MIIRRSTMEDIPAMVSLYESARKSMAEMNLDQWQGATPNADTAKIDVEKKQGVVCVEDGEIIATAAVYVGDEITYKKLDSGSWFVDSEVYGVVHRLAVSPNHKRKGIAYKLMEYGTEITKEAGIKSVRCDTHIDNIPMQNAMNKFGFKYCGEITILDGTSRIAFEYVL
ncbi:MAG: GNAT family N-acetyltransferase [Clostridia bacterium]